MLSSSHIYFTLLFAFVGKGIWKKVIEMEDNLLELLPYYVLKNIVLFFFS
jgi:hypothetical protein